MGVMWCPDAYILKFQDFILLKFSYTESHKIYTHLWGVL